MGTGPLSHFGCFSCAKKSLSAKIVFVFKNTFMYKCTGKINKNNHTEKAK